MGFNSVTLTYEWRGDDDAGSASDDGIVEIKSSSGNSCSNGSGWTTLNNHDLRVDSSWQAQGSTTNAGMNNTSFLLRFRTDTNDSDEHFRVDGILITGTTVNTAPTANAQSVTTDEDMGLAINLTGTDTDIPAQTLTYATTSNPTNGTLSGFNPSTGAVTYTPALNYTGADSFTFRVNDGVINSTSATISITVNPLNDVPTGNADAYSTDEDTTLNVPARGVLINDTDIESPSASLTSVIVTPSSHGTTTLNSDGSFTFEPELNYSGTDSFTYVPNDGTGDGNVTTVTINISSVNDTPVAVADSYTVDEDNVLTATTTPVIANDTDADANPLSATLVTGTSNGGLTFNSDGTFTYTPNTNYNGSDSFTYKVNDGTVDSGVAVVTITVNPINDAPTVLVAVEAPVVTYTLNYPYVDKGATAYDTEDGDITSSIVTTNDLNMGAVGTYTFVYTATDSGSLSASTTRTVNVVPALGGAGGGSGKVGCMDSKATNYDKDAAYSGPCTYGSVLGAATSTLVAASSSQAGGATTTPQGQVLGVNNICKETGTYIRNYLRRGANNNIYEVKRLQEFLNEELGIKLVISGVFDKETEDAVKVFQFKYSDTILSPWGLNRATGIVYITTLNKINSKKCPEIKFENPTRLVPMGVVG